MEISTIILIFLLLMYFIWTKFWQQTLFSRNKTKLLSLKVKYYIYFVLEKKDEKNPIYQEIIKSIDNYYKNIEMLSFQTFLEIRKNKPQSNQNKSNIKFENVLKKQEPLTQEHFTQYKYEVKKLIIEQVVYRNVFLILLFFAMYIYSIIKDMTRKSIHKFLGELMNEKKLSKIFVNI